MSNLDTTTPISEFEVDGVSIPLSSKIDILKTDTSTIPEIYNLLQTKFNENKSVSFTLKYIGYTLGASVPSYGYDPNVMEIEPYNINLQLLNDTQRTYLPCKVIGISNSRIQCPFETIDAVGSFEIAENNIYGLSLNYQHVVSEKYAIGCDFNELALSSSDRNYGLSILSC